MARRFMQATVIVMGAIVLAGVLAGCGGGKAEESKPAISGSSKPNPTLQEFFEADTLTGDFTLTTVNAAGETTFEGTGTVWVDGDQFRYSVWQDGVHLRDVMSPDGKTAYFAQEDEKVCEPAVSSVESYLAEYSQPAPESVEDGTDPATGATRMVYTVKSVVNMPGAANGWYTEDITYLVKDGSVIGVIKRGDTPKDDGAPYELDTTTRMFTRLVAGEKIDPKTFELPYPIRDAN